MSSILAGVIGEVEEISGRIQNSNSVTVFS